MPPEREAFQHAYSELFAYILEEDPHLTIVNILYSCGVLNKTTRDAVTDPCHQRANQIRCLLRELEIQIESRPSVYIQLVSELKGYNFNQLSELLQQKYGKIMTTLHKIHVY